MRKRLKYLKAATQLKPTAHADESLAKAWVALGRVEESTSAQEALAAYSEAARLNPKDPQPHLAAAALQERQGNLDAAASQFHAALDLDPKSQAALSGLANVYISQKKYPEAEAELRKLLAADPENSNAHIQLGRVLAEEGKNDEAAQELQKEGRPTRATARQRWNSARYWWTPVSMPRLSSSFASQ